MVAVTVIAEGQTEEQFIKRLIAPAVRHLGVFVKPQMLQTSPGHRGGAVSYDRLKLYARNELRRDSKVVLSTFLDLYALDSSFPGFSEVEAKPWESRLAHLRQALHKAIVEAVGCASERFIPHIQPHEFEGLLFSDTQALAQIELGWRNSEGKLAAVRAGFNTPEHINNSHETAPSKRLEKLLQPGYRKTRHGPLAAERITLTVMERECPHFHAWMDGLRAFGRVCR
ncbi:MAG: DUF4276 family protein [Rhodanobacter sp.]|jgi:hypothetical protein|nr:DUF4276 family protein [Rhodanobacter sp.]